MSPCKTVELLYSLIPLKAWRGFLLSRHMESCPHCQAALVSRQEAGSLLLQEKGAAPSGALWTKVESALLEETRGEGSKVQAGRPDFRLRWGWAVATASLGAVLLGFLFLRDFRTGRVSADAVPARFELDYVRVGGQPANAVVYQPQGSDMIIVWAGKNP